LRLQYAPAKEEGAALGGDVWPTHRPGAHSARGPRRPGV